MGVGILLGGKSRRMGRDKAFLTLGEKPFWELVLEQCGPFSSVYFSVSSGIVFRELPGMVVADEKEGYGPLEGIYQILRTAKEEAVFILAVDMPFITIELLEKLAREWKATDRCLVLRKEERLQPMCGIYSRELLPVVYKLRKQGEHRLQVLLEAAPCRVIDMETLEIPLTQMENINTPEEYRRAQRIFQSGTWKRG